MNKYLEKIAEKEEKGPSLKERLGTAAMASVAGGIAATPLSLAGGGLAKSIMKDIEGSTYTKEDLSTLKKSVTESGLRGKVTFIGESSSARGVESRVKAALKAAEGESGKLNRIMRQNTAMAARFSDGPANGAIRAFGGTKDIITVGTGKHIASPLHEVGHSRLSELTRGVMPKARMVSSNLVATPLLLLTSSDQEKRDKVVPLAAALQAPTLVDEAFANSYALRKLQKHQGAMSALKAAPGLAKAMGTYIGAAGAAVGGAYVAKKVADNLYLSLEKGASNGEGFGEEAKKEMAQEAIQTSAQKAERVGKSKVGRRLRVAGRALSRKISVH